MNLASRTPPAVPHMKATMPMARMPSVIGLRKDSAFAVAPTETPRKITTMFMSSFCAVLDRRSTTPHSRNRLPSIRLPTSGAALGTSRATNAVTAIGKTIFSFLETVRRASMRIMRSFFVVRPRMMGGWMTGTSAM